MFLGTGSTSGAQLAAIIGMQVASGSPVLFEDGRETMDGNGGQKAQCPVAHGASGRRNRDWWPNQLNIEVLHQHSPLSDPMGEDFDYPEEFKSLDLNAVVADLH